MKRSWIIGTLAGLAATSAQAGDEGFGVRAGFSMDPDQFVLGAHMETGRVLGPACLVPSVDLHVDDNNLIMINVDARWYLLPIPDTGLEIYGGVGPALAIADGDNEIGFTVTGGLDIPSSRGRRYAVETRFGFSDMPDLKLMFGITW